MKISTIACAATMAFAMCACQQDMPVFSDTEAFLGFHYGDGLTTDKVTDKMGKESYSFIMKADVDQTSDTIWIQVDSYGALSNADRPIALQQVQSNAEGVANAQPGVHYVPFDNADLQKFYVMPANSCTARIPVVILRDASLKNEEVTLQLTFKDNGVFKAGYTEFATYTINLSDQLSKPSMWELVYASDLFGTYGTMKHQLMITWTKQKWDDDYFMSVCNASEWSGEIYWNWNNYNYIAYLAAWMEKKLQEENAERVAAGLDVYKEADGTPVSFVPEESDWDWGY